MFFHIYRNTVFNFFSGAVFSKVTEDSSIADVVDKWIVVKLGMKYVVYRKGDGRFYNYLRIDTTKKDKVITGKVIVIEGGTFPIAKSISKRYFSFIKMD